MSVISVVASDEKEYISSDISVSIASGPSASVKTLLNQLLLDAVLASSSGISTSGTASGIGSAVLSC